MASHASALKAHRQSLARRARNRQYRSQLRTALKSIRSALRAKNVAAATDQLRATVSLIDRMARKGIIHKNTAARYKSRLATGLARTSAAA